MTDRKWQMECKIIHLQFCGPKRSGNLFRNFGWVFSISGRKHAHIVCLVFFKKYVQICNYH